MSAAVVLASLLAAQASALTFTSSQAGPTTWVYDVTFAPLDNYSLFQNVTTLTMTGLSGVTSASGPTSTDFDGNLNSVNLAWTAQVLNGGTTVVWSHNGPGTGSPATVRHIYGFSVAAPGAQNGVVSFQTSGFVSSGSFNTFIDISGTLPGPSTTARNTVLHSFSGADGSQPQGALIQGSDGNFYGTTYFGGSSGSGSISNNLGTVFKTDSHGNVTVVHSFFGPEGAHPSASLVQGRDGAFYGTTAAGGAGGIGTIFKMSQAGDVTVLHSFFGTDGRAPSAPLVQAKDGSFYGTAALGGNLSCAINFEVPGCGTIFRIDTNGNFTLLHAFSGPDGRTPEAALLQASDGNFYGTTAAGGTVAGGGPASGTIFRMDSSGRVTTLHAFTGGFDGNAPTAPLIQTSSGSFYGTASSGSVSTGNGTIFKMDASGNITTLHAFSGPDGAFPATGLVQATDGNFYGATQKGGNACNNGAGCGTLFRMDSSGTLTVLNRLAGFDGAGPSAALVQGKDGNLYGTTQYGGSANDGVIFELSDIDTAFTLNPTSATVPASASTGTVAVKTSSASASWAVTSNVSWITVTSGASGSGNGIVTYSVAANSSTSSRTGTFTIAGLTFTVTQSAAVNAPAVTITGVYNGASFQDGLASGAWVTIRGTNLSTTTRQWQSSDFVGNNLPTSLDGVRVNINGRAAYVYYISPTQLNVLAPDDPSTGAVPVQIVNSQGASNTISVNKQALAPALFAYSQQNGRYAIAQDASTYGLIAPAGLLGSTSTSLATPGQIITLYATGLGPTTPPYPAGQTIQNPEPLSNPIQVLIGNIAAKVQFAGITGPGLYQINVTVSNLPTGDASVIVSVNGTQSLGQVYIPVQAPPPPGKFSITATTPAPNATGISMTASVQIIFNQPVDPATVGSATFTFANAGTPLPATVALDSTGKIVTVTPSGVLSPATTYTVKVAATVRDTAGDSLGTAYSSSFTTIPPATVTGTVNVPSGVDPTTLSVVSFSGNSTTPSSNGGFSATVSPTGTTFVAAMFPGKSFGLIAVAVGGMSATTSAAPAVPPGLPASLIAAPHVYKTTWQATASPAASGTTGLVADFQTTAEALVFMSPYLLTSDPQPATKILTAIAANPATARLAQTLANSWSQADPLSDPIVQAARQNTVQAVVQMLSQQTPKTEVTPLSYRPLLPASASTQDAAAALSATPNCWSFPNHTTPQAGLPCLDLDYISFPQSPIISDSATGTYTVRPQNCTGFPVGCTVGWLGQIEPIPPISDNSDPATIRALTDSFGPESPIGYDSNPPIAAVWLVGNGGFQYLNLKGLLANSVAAFMGASFSISGYFTLPAIPQPGGYIVRFFSGGLADHDEYQNLPAYVGGPLLAKQAFALNMIDTAFNALKALNILPSGTESCAFEKMVPILAQDLTTWANVSDPPAIATQLETLIPQVVRQVGVCTVDAELKSYSDMFLKLFSWGDGVGELLATVRSVAALGQSFQRAYELGFTATPVETGVIAPTNPMPSIASLSPSSVTAGATTPLLLTITGTNFTSRITVTLNGITHAATFIDSTRLTITLIASDLATAGAYPLIATNPPPGGSSQPVTFIVQATSTQANYCYQFTANTFPPDTYGALTPVRLIVNIKNAPPPMNFPTNIPSVIYDLKSVSGNSATLWLSLPPYTTVGSLISDDPGAFQVIISRSSSFSAMNIITPGFQIVLSGEPALFSTFALPALIPPLSAYNSTSIFPNGLYTVGFLSSQQLDSVGSCDTPGK